MKNENSTPCLICNRTFIKPAGLSTHIRHSHDISKEEYYLTYIDNGAGKCATCGNKTVLISIPEGYRKFCSRTCNNKNPELAKQRGNHLAATNKKDPSIRQKSAAKRKKTLDANPTIWSAATKKSAKTCRKNPHILERANKKRSETYANRDDATKLKDSQNRSVRLREFYTRANQNPSTEKHYIYLVSHASIPIVKIGVATNIERRMASLQAAFGPVKIIKAVETTYAVALATELKMHKQFKQQCNVQPSGSGRTEWFNECITEDAIQILTQPT